MDSLSSIGYRVAFVRGGEAFGPPAEVFILDLDKNSITKAPESEECMFPEWSPDGTMLTFDCQDDNGQSVYISTLDGQQRYPILPHPPILQSGSPVWSPDGKWLAYYAGQFRSGIASEYNGIYITTVESILNNEIPSHLNTRGQISDTNLFSWTSDGELLFIDHDPMKSVYMI